MEHRDDEGGEDLRRGDRLRKSLEARCPYCGSENVEESESNPDNMICECGEEFIHEN